MSEENEAILYGVTKSVKLMSVSFEEVAKALEILRSKKKLRLPRKLKKLMKIGIGGHIHNFVLNRETLKYWIETYKDEGFNLNKYRQCKGKFIHRPKQNRTTKYSKL